MKLILPSKIKKETVPKITHEVFDNKLHPKYDNFELDLSDVDYIEPGGIVALTNIISLLQHKGVKGKLTLGKNNSEKHNKVINYLIDSYFFARKFDYLKTREPFNNLTILPLEQINFSKIFSWKDDALDSWLKRNTNNNSSFSNVKTVVDEIYNNIKDHSTEEVGSIFGQFIPSKNILILCISDFGVGIPTLLRDKYPSLKDNELLEMSIVEGVSTQSTPRNRGAGLKNIIRSATINGIGTVYIMSNYGIIEIENEKVIRSKNTDKFYPGTFYEIRIDITNNNLYDSEAKEEFEWSL